MAEQLTDVSISFYLMKAEPDSRVVKGKDVKFSVDDFETAQTTAWEGVRNYEARNLMQGMRVGDKVLFYHSNTKNPGIAGFAEVSKEAYPDHTAWDETHPYHDVKSDASSPRWYMVDVQFASRVEHFVPLSLLRHLSTLSESPTEMSYLNATDLKAIKAMALLNKGRLSVQRVEKEAWVAINKIAKEGDGGIDLKASKRGAISAADRKNKGHAKSQPRTEGEDGDEEAGAAKGKVKGKRKVKATVMQEEQESRRSKRAKK